MGSIMHSFLDKKGVIQVVLGLEVANSLEEIMEEALEEVSMVAFLDQHLIKDMLLINHLITINSLQCGVAAPPANYNVVAYSAWCIDLGATNHDTQDAANIKTLNSPDIHLTNTIPWIFYRKVIGVSNFFLFVEGKLASPAVSNVFESIPGVKVIYKTRELEEQQANIRIWNETWLSRFFYKPCNYEVFVKQSLNMEMAIVMARDAGMDWIIRLDADELIHACNIQEYSGLLSSMHNASKQTSASLYPGGESCIERDDMKEPFSEVSMFKKNYDHLPKDVYFGNYREAARNNPHYFLTYGNGKAAARVQDHLRPNGAHRTQCMVILYHTNCISSASMPCLGSYVAPAAQTNLFGEKGERKGEEVKL
ncbi:hypothetical protein WN944_024152 [Citrus x changshan-huyou]|uniref:Glycosyltransferase family 92 protein n=1 Tax=Citrus x changshan-huyou TaxID=2935761 RepID=A0AAP0LRY0_9ROSI